MSATVEETTVGHAVTLAPTPNDRPAWLAIRRRGIGGSDAAAICGQDPYRSALEVWLDKTGALPDDDRDSEAAAWGRILEGVVAYEVQARTGVVLSEVHSVLQHPDLPWQLANVDRVATDDIGTGIYEGKTAGVFAADGWNDGGVPDKYLLQGMHYLSVTGLPWLLFGALIGGQRLEVRRVERDDELIAHLTTLEAEFWGLVEAGTPPAPDGSAACTDLLAHLWDVTPGAVRTLDPADVLPLIEARAEAAAVEKAAKAAKAEAENRLKALIEDAEEAVDPDGRRLFTWKTQSRTGLDLEAAERVHAELHAPRQIATTTFRVLRIPKGKK